MLLSVAQTCEAVIIKDPLYVVFIIKPEPAAVILPVSHTSPVHLFKLTIILIKTYPFLGNILLADKLV